MHSKNARQLGLLLTLAAGLMGFRNVSMSSSASDTPLVRTVESKTRTNATKCSFYALGWIPTSEPTTLDGFLREMAAGTDGMTDVTVESSSTNLLLVSWQCWRIAGTPFSWGRPLVAPVAAPAADGSAPVTPDGATADAEPAVANPAAPEQPAAEPAPVPVAAQILPPPPPQAAPLTERLLKQIGVKKPESEDAFRQLCTEVWNLRQQNKLNDRDMVQVTRSGQGKVAPGSDLMTILKAGLDD